MEAKILTFPHRLREVPTQEIRSIYEDLYREQLRQQEELMPKKQNDPENDPEFYYKLYWMAILAFDGLLAFVVGYVIGGL